MRKKDYEKALNYIALAHEMYPDSFEPYFSLGKYYAGKGPYNLAIKTFSNLLRDFPNECENNPDFYSYLGTIYAKEKLYEEAISNYKKTLTLRPIRPIRRHNRDIYNSIGNAYFHKN
jgi:tetratricopeptide (TPR) repeat protein